MARKNSKAAATTVQVTEAPPAPPSSTSKGSRKKEPAPIVFDGNDSGDSFTAPAATEVKYSYDYDEDGKLQTDDDTPDESQEPVSETPDVPDETPVPEQTLGPIWDQALLARARVAGLDADSFTSPAALERVLSKLEATVNAPEVKTGKFKLELGDVVDEDVANQLKAMNDHYGAQVEELRAQVAAAKANTEQVATVAFEQTFDTLCNGLPTEYEKFLGKGVTRHMDRRSAAYKTREQILARMVRMQDLADSPQSNFKDSLFATLKDKIVDLEKSRLAGRARDRAETIMDRPSSSSVDAKGEANDPVAFVRNFFRQKRGA